MSRSTMTHALRAGLVAAAAATALAACSSSKNNGGGTGSLATHDVGNVGTVLANKDGMTLYTAEQESDGTIKCTGACLQIWKPVTGNSTSAPSGVSGTIATVKRDGQTQLTYNGAPLYTFAEDSAAGDAKGNNAKDAFGSNHFTWHAVVITPSAGGSSSSDTGGGYGNGY